MQLCTIPSTAYLHTARSSPPPPQPLCPSAGYPGTKKIPKSEITNQLNTYWAICLAILHYILQGIFIA
jgi:hypothetical protein